MALSLKSLLTVKSTVVYQCSTLCVCVCGWSLLPARAKKSHNPFHIYCSRKLTTSGSTLYASLIPIWNKYEFVNFLGSFQSLLLPVQKSHKPFSFLMLSQTHNFWFDSIHFSNSNLEQIWICQFLRFIPIIIASPCKKSRRPFSYLLLSQTLNFWFDSFCFSNSNMVQIWIYQLLMFIFIIIASPCKKATQTLFIFIAVANSPLLV